MGERLELQSLLEGILGSRNVYFQPPESVKLSYPCIVYRRSTSATKFADNGTYCYKIGYMLTVIDRNPDSTIPNTIAMLPLCKFERHYTKDNLNHDVYIIYY